MEIVESLSNPNQIGLTVFSLYFRGISNCMRIGVLGGSGYVGSSIVDALKAQAMDVVVV